MTRKGLPELRQRLPILLQGDSPRERFRKVGSTTCGGGCQDAAGQPPAEGETSQAPKTAAKAEDESAGEATADFEIYNAISRKSRFRIKLGDESLVMASKGYESKADIMKMVKQM